MRAQLAALEKEQADLEMKYSDAEKERAELYDKFDAMVRIAQCSHVFLLLRLPGRFAFYYCHCRYF